MRKTLKDTWRILTYNFKTLFYFQILYSVLGALIIFPLAQFLFFTSIKLSGFTYVTNALLIDYLTKPFTIFSLFSLLTLLSIYMMIEMIILSLIFENGYREETLGIKDLVIKGGKRVYHILRRYHVRIMFPAFFFFILVELFHVVGIAQTINIPHEIVYVLNQNIWYVVFLVVLIVLIFILFIETIFHFNLYAIDAMAPHDARKASRVLLKGKRIEMGLEFILLNLILNIVLYSFYALIILLVGGIVTITKGAPFALSIVLTIFYSLYVLIGFLATITLVPINFALMTSWYEERREKNEAILAMSERVIKIKPFKNERYLKWGLIVIGSVMFVINLISVIHVTRQQRSQIEILNYAEIIAHRGQSFDAPENTLAAIELAIINGADAVEIDIRETKDHVPVLIHDATTKRTTNDTLTRYVNQLTLEEIKALDAGSWFSSEYREERIPTLEEVLIAIQGRTKLLLEFKDQGTRLEQNVFDLLKAYNMVENTVILSFSSQQLRRVKMYDENLQTLLLLHSFFGRLEDLASAPYADHFGISLAFYTGNEVFIDIAHQQGKKVYVWTVNDESTMKLLVDNDIDGIITDRPVLAREIAYSKNAPEFLLEILKRFFNKNEQGLN